MSTEKQVKPSKPLALKSWGLNWFKSVQRARIDLAPLTVLVGKNSAGKSTLFQSILLLSGNQSSQPDTLQLNTPIFKGGNMGDVLNRGSYEPDEKSYNGFFSLSGELVVDAGISREVRGKKLDPWTAEFERIETVLSFDLSFGEDASIGSTSTRLFLGKLSGVTNLGHFYKVEIRPNAHPYSAPFQEETVTLEDFEDQSDTYSVSVTFSKSNLKHMPYEPTESIAFEFVGDRFRDWLPTTLTHKSSIYEEIALQLLLPQHWQEEEKDQFLVNAFNNLDNDDFTSASRQMLDNPPSEDDLFVDHLLRWVKFSVEELIELIKQDKSESDKYAKLQMPGFGDQIPYLIRSVLDKEIFGYYEFDFDSLGEIQDRRSALIYSLAKKILDLPMSSSLQQLGTYKHPLFPLLGSQTLRNPLGTLFRNRVLYLGPLREAPKFAYTQDSVTTANTPVGIRGEATYEVLSTQRTISINQRFSMVVPPGTPVNSRRTLQEATDIWLEYFFGEGAKVSVSKPNQFGIDVKFGDESLTNVGVGVSQLLPIIVLCLISKPGQLILLEQPELHLHPALQQKLADFFLTVSKSGRQMIIETHSEYLITRLRLRTVQDPDTSKQYQIVFAENDEVDGTTYRPVEVDENGSLETWPEGFFDEASSDMEQLVQHLINKKKN